MSRAATPADVIAGAARWCVVEGDALDVVRQLPVACLDAVVTDPPSGIAFMGAEWDRDKGGRAQWVAWLAEVLGLARAATRDGGRALVWSLPRTSHWTGCAVEDAGWSIESTITHLFGTGWPKGQSQLKPAAETWWLARTGRSEALNIEGCRVGVSKRVPGSLSVSQLNGYGVANRRGQSLDDSGHRADVGRYPPNVVLSHSPGCVLTGERKVQSDSPKPYTRSVDATRDFGLPKPAGTSPVSHVDPDGTETVDAWECVEPTAARVPLFVVGTMRPSGPAHEPELLPGLLRSALRDSFVCSTNDTSPLHGEGARGDIEGIRSIEVAPSPADAAARVLGLTELLGSLGDCQSCLRSCDERVRQVAAAFRESPLQLLGVLADVCSGLFAPARNRPAQCRGRQSSSGDSQPSCDRKSTPQSSTPEASRALGSSGESSVRTAGMTSPAQPPAGAGGSSRPSKTACATDTSETCSCTGCTETHEILLTTWCLFVLCEAFHWIVSRQWIDIQFGGCPVAELDRQSGETRTNGSKSPTRQTSGIFGGADRHSIPADHGDTGTAARYFPQFPADEYALFGYHAKPSRGEKNAGLDGMPRADRASVAPVASGKVMRCTECRRTHPMTYRGVCKRCSADAVAIDDAADDGSGRDGCRVHANTHPTVKSIALMRWLVRLVTRPGDVVLDPFGGSGTTGVAALCEGRRVILVEREPRFAEIARQRCEHATPDLGVPVRVAAKPAPAADPRQLGLFGGDP